MYIKKHKIEGHWVYGEYNFYIGKQLVAKLRRQLIGMDYAYLYFLADLYKDNDQTRIDIRYLLNEEVVDKASKIVRKKLYLKASNILSSIKEITIES